MGKKFWANIILCVFIGGVASVVLANINSALKPKGLLATDPEPSSDAAALMPSSVRMSAPCRSTTAILVSAAAVSVIRNVASDSSTAGVFMCGILI